MKKLGRQGRFWLKGFHILFICGWIGAALSATIISFFVGNAADGSELYAYNASVKLLDLIIIPSGMGTLITGLLLAWQTAWGFFKYWWVIVTGVVMIAALVFGFVCLAPWTTDLVTISKAEGLRALQNGEYLHAWQMIKIFGTAQTIVIIFAAFVSVIKPWGKREKAQVTA